MTKRNTHLEAAKEYIAVAESGDSKRTAYEKAADEIIAAMAEDSTLTQGKVGAEIGKGDTWVGRLLKWRSAPEQTGLPFARDPENDFRARYESRQVPTALPDKIEMAEKLLADRAVAEEVVRRAEVGARYVAVAQSEVEAEWKQRQRENTPDETYLPLHLQVPVLVGKIQNVHADFRNVLPDLELITNPSDRNTLIRMVRDFQGTLELWVEALTDRPLATVHDIQ